MDTQDRRESAQERGMKSPEGDIFTGSYKNFQQRYDYYKQDIFDENIL